MAEMSVGKNSKMVSTQSPLAIVQNTLDRAEQDTALNNKFPTEPSPNHKPKSKGNANYHNRHKKWLTLAAIGGALLLLFIGMWLIVKAAQMLPDAQITINKTNLTPSQLAQLQQALGKTADGNFYRANLQDYQARAQALPWVSQVDVKRDWQKGLLVNVIPRQPVAKFGSEKLIDATGQVFVPADSEQLTAQKWMQLQSEPEKSALIMQQTEQVTKWFRPLGMKVEEVILTPRMTWLFRFDNGLRVLVDKESTSEKMYQLSILLQNQLKNKLAQIETVDLRYKNGMALTWKHTNTANSLESTTNNDAAAKNLVTSQTANTKSTSRQSVKPITTAKTKTAG